MDLDELPRVQTSATGMNQEPCGSETISGFPCASDGRLAWVSESAEQAVNTPNDEERLEQMSHPKNKVMERMTPLERWNGLAWVCTKWLWKGLPRCRGGVFSGHSVPPNTTRSTRQALAVWVTRHFHFFPRQTKDKPWKHRLRERTNRRLRRQPSKKHSKPMFRARHGVVTCSRTHQGMDTDGLERVTDGHENWVSPKSFTKEANQQGVSL